jgi:UDP-N-acetylmuramate--alanine ligase
MTLAHPLDIATVDRIHFVGIGGISMSGLAAMCLAQGKEVSGSDRSDSPLLDELRKQGARIFIGHSRENVSPVAQLVVYSAAVPDDNPELVYAREKGIALLTRAEFLGLVTRRYSTIAVAGTHGKTTTSAMLTKVMKDGGLDPTALVGSVMTEYKSNFLAGGDKYLVVEACEYERQFLDLEPAMLIVTNIEEDHLDYYKDIDDIREAFRAFALKVPEEGAIITSLADQDIVSVFRDAPAQIVDYEGMSTLGLALPIPGAHNVRNAQAVLAAAEKLGIPRPSVLASLNAFPGTWRRFEYKGATKSGVEVYDDYAHHPTAIKVTLAGAREKFSDKKMVVVFQPHLYSRTKDFLSEFAQSFIDADEVIFADIYAAREVDDGTVSSQDLATEAMKYAKAASYLPNFELIIDYLKKTTAPGDVIITMGAGNIEEVALRLVGK